MGLHPTADCEESENDAERKAIISQQYLIYKMLRTWIRNSLTTDAKQTLRSYKTSYAYNSQDDGAAILFFIVKMVRPDTRAA